MKKILLLMCLSLSLVGCNNVETKDNTTQSDLTTQETMSEGVEKEVEASEETSNTENKLTTIKIISTEVSEPLGDRTADNYADENGEYFAIGSDIVKCSDYDNIHVVAELTNNRENLLKTSAIAWSAKMEDGYNLELFQNGIGIGMMNDGDLGKQIQSGSSVTVEFDILKEKTIKGNKIILTYTDINYDDTYTEFFQKALSGSSEEELQKEYPQFFDESLHYNFEIPLN